MNIYYFDETGNCTGAGTSATCPNKGATQLKPKTDKDKWDGTKWINPPLSTQEEIEEIANTEIEKKIRTMTVTTLSKKTFHADDQARINIIAGVMSAEFAKKTQTTWKLYDKDENGKNIEALVTLDELREANYLALEKFGAIKSIGV